MVPTSELDSISGPELVLGLIGPVGADLTAVADALQTELGPVGYRTIEIRVSSLIPSVKAFGEYADKDYASDFDRIDELMDAGTNIRRETGHGDALALLTVAEIRRARMDENRALHPEWDEELLTKTPLEHTAYIVRSLKNPAEVQTLRDVYGRAFFVVSAYSPRTRRVSDLAHQICKSAHDSDPDRYRSQAEALVSKDESEGDDFGQNVRDCFPLADVFVDLNDGNRVKSSIERFVELLFGNPFHTPSRDEFAMFHAFATALRSADLSRQIGAAIATDDGQILAIGCNEVPKFDGGHYWPGDSADRRDFQTGYDSGATARIDIVSEILQRLQEADLAADELQNMNAREAAERFTRGDRKEVLRDTQALNVIEYGRAVHAEMAALMDAARRGISVQDATLYCTTFPCHLCARHIVAAGITRVVYIEPYPKSAAAELFKDSMVVDPESPADDRVSFQAFVGIAPSVYPFMFRVEDVRKNRDGTAARWEANSQRDPRFRRFVLSYMTIEDLVTGSVIPNTFSGEYEIIGASEGSN